MRSKSFRVANRYARAIFSLAHSDKPTFEKVLADLRAMVRLLQTNPELMKAVTNPAFPLNKRVFLVGDLCEKLKTQVFSRHSIMVIATADRMGAFLEVVEKIELLHLKEAKLVPITVETSNELSVEEKKRVVSRFSIVLGNPVEPIFSVNPTLIGGFRATAAGKTYDGSVLGWLNCFKESSARIM